VSQPSATRGCACKRGFFVLRDCGAAPTTTCASCARPVCDEHRADGGRGATCVECAARAVEEEALGQLRGGMRVAPDQPPSVAPAEAAEPLARYRHRYYRRHGYEPIWWARPDASWSADDVRWFDADEDPGGFGDS
jgi:hypothetical protein